jgi:serine/threonine protein kinase
MTSGSGWQPQGLGGALVPGGRLAGYLIEEQIGAGGMAVVFRARDEMLGRLAAVKVMAPALASDQEFRARFLRESRSVAAVESPHIIPVYAAGEAGGVLYIATRYVSGGDLGHLVRQSGGTLAPALAVTLTGQVAAALDAAHAAGLVHRDVKPGNILVESAPGREPHAYLSDFGLSKSSLSASAGLSVTGQFLGTPEYCPPEQIRGGAVDGRADQYALACVAFALLTGVPPFHRADTIAIIFAQLNDPVPSVTALRPELPTAVGGVLERALAKSPADRYQTCGEFAAALRDALPQRGPATVTGWGAGPGPDKHALLAAAPPGAPSMPVPPAAPSATPASVPSLPDTAAAMRPESDPGTMTVNRPGGGADPAPPPTNGRQSPPPPANGGLLVTGLVLALVTSIINLSVPFVGSGGDLAARGISLYQPVCLATFLAALVALMLPARRWPLACAVLGANVIAFAFATWDVLAIPPELDIIGNGYLLATTVGLAGTAIGILTTIVLAVAIFRHATPGGQADRRPGRPLRVALGCAAVLAAVGWGLLWGSSGYAPDTGEVVVGVIAAVLAIVLALRLRNPAEGGALLVGWSVMTAGVLTGPGESTSADYFVLFLTVILAALYMRRRVA